jgi:DHA2 family methylenomycin A resistance protein-like MFS transporter
MIVGGLTGAGGYALLGVFGISDHAGFWAMLPGLALIPAGMGLAVPAMTTSILASVPGGQAGTASAVLNTARQVGGALGVAVYGAMVAAGTPAMAMAGLRTALAVSAALLLTAAAIAWQCIAAPAAAVGRVRPTGP